jgi:hypothetical protein
MEGHTPRMTKFYGWLLVVELCVVAAAPVIFTTVENRLIAGIMAGTLFVGLGVFIVMVGVQNKPFRRVPTFWAGCLHLFGSALPLLITRMVNFSHGFENVLVLGLPGPVFHRISTGVFAILLIATAFDLIRAWRARRP